MLFRSIIGRDFQGFKKNILAFVYRMPLVSQLIFSFFGGGGRLKPVFHFNRTVPKRTGEHAQIEKGFINPRTSGYIRVSKRKVRRKSTFWRTTEVLTNQNSLNFEI